MQNPNADLGIEETIKNVVQKTPILPYFNDEKLTHRPPFLDKASFLSASLAVENSVQKLANKRNSKMATHHSLHYYLVSPKALKPNKLHTI